MGTARNRRSKVWFTVADGVLSDVYFPTNDNTNNETLQFVVTDGRTFTDLQTRDMTHTARALDERALTCRVTSTAKSGRYRIVTDYVTDPARPTVLMRSRFEPLGRHDGRNLRLYVRFDPTLNGNGGGGTGNGGPDSGDIARAGGHTLLVGSDPVTETNAANRDYAVPVHSALDASRPFLEVSNGFAGQASDGLTQLDADRRLTERFAQAAQGNLVQTARIDLGRDGSFELALGFGEHRAAAVDATRRTLNERFGSLEREYTRGWRAYDARLVKPRRPKGVSPGRWRNLVDEYYLSANYVKAAEDKTFPGAVAAALASPWGQAVSAGDPNSTYFGSYREVFARDLYEAWSALLLAGDRRTARAMTRFLFERQQLPDGSMPRNSLTNGALAPDSFGTQLDECSYPLIMALDVGLTGRDFYENHVKPAANFVISRGPAFGPERWEEQSGFSPSTIAAEIAGLLAAARIADRNGDGVSAAVWRGVADEFQRKIKDWTVTSNGSLSPEPYFIRLSKTGDPNAMISYSLGNGGPTLDQREVIDAGFLELARLGVLSKRDPDLLRSLPVVDATIRRETDSGAGFLRYNGDGYGDRSSDGRPWAPVGEGNGHVWPVLAGERGQWELDTGDLGAAVRRLEAMRNMSSGVGLIPEQAWELPDLARSPFGSDPTLASIGFENGKPAGSASALTWSAGQFVRLMLDVSAGRVLDRPRYTLRRYVKRTQAETPLTVTSPADNSAVEDSVEVTGTSAPGNSIAVAASNLDDNTRTTTHTTTRRAGRQLQPHRAAHGRYLCPEHRGHQPGGRDRARGAHGRVRLRSRHAALRGRRPGRRRQRSRQLRLSDLGQLQARRLRPPAIPGLRLRRPDHLQGPHARSVTHLRQPARRAAGRRLRPCAGRGPDLDRGVVPTAQLRDRPGGRVEQADRGSGVRAALCRCRRRHAWDREHQRQCDLALHHLQRHEGEPRDPRTRLGLHRRAHRPGRLQPGSGARLPVHSPGLPVRRLQRPE